jgi:hypothetical protein
LVFERLFVELYLKISNERITTNSPIEKFYFFRFSLIGIQDIGSKESLDHIIQELNNPIIPSIKDSHHGKWKCVISDGISQLFQVDDLFLFICYLFFCIEEIGISWIYI